MRVTREQAEFQSTVLEEIPLCMDAKDINICSQAICDRKPDSDLARVQERVAQVAPF